MTSQCHFTIPCYWCLKRRGIRQTDYRYVYLSFELSVIVPDFWSSAWGSNVVTTIITTITDHHYFLVVPFNLVSTKSVLITLIYWIIYSPYYQFICLFIYLIFCSCVQAEPPVNASTRDKYCIFYEYTTGTLCKGIITSLYVFGNQATVDYGDRETFTFQSYFNFFEISERCQPIMRDLFCRYHYQPCDMSLRIPRPRRICRRTCEHLDYVLCVKEMAFIRNAAKTAPRFDYDMINCSIYTVANGGEAPECYQYQPLLGLYTEGSPVLFNRPSLARIRFQMGSFFWGPENFVNIINFEFFQELW